MQDFFEWFVEKGIDPNRPWLILGKGPSFAKRKEHDLSCYHVMSLNHVVREQPVTVAHLIDYDVVDACGEAILTNAEYLVLPWIPHVNNRAGRQDLEELARTNTVLRKLNEQGRMLWYNHSLTRKRRGNSPVVRVRLFSAEAALNLLGQAGVRRIRSLGVDGGAAYSHEFGDLKDQTLLANGRKSFDRQFEEIARTISLTGVDYSPLDIESPVKVFVGATEAEMLPAKVLEHSIRKRASITVEVSPLYRAGIAIPLPKDPEQRPRTPFSFQRFIIPALMGYRGRAIYLDSDMQVFKDIRALWTMPFDGADLLTIGEPELSGRKLQLSVMILNCESLQWDIREIVRALDERRLTYEQLVYEMAIAKHISAGIAPEWNALEHFSARETALLHFTDMNTQPWVSTENPLGYLWTGELIEAIDAGALSIDFVKQEVAAGHVRPSLVYQVEKRIEDSLLLSRRARRLDESFVAPYRFLPQHHDSVWRRPGKRLRALLRHCYQNNPVYRYQCALHDWYHQ